MEKVFFQFYPIYNWTCWVRKSYYTIKINLLNYFSKIIRIRRLAFITEIFNLIKIDFSIFWWLIDYLSIAPIYAISMLIDQNQFIIIIIIIERWIPIGTPGLRPASPLPYTSHLNS